MTSPFDIRRQSDPQGLIDDLVGQTTRQAAEIHRLLELSKTTLKPDDIRFLLSLLKGTHPSVEAMRIVHRPDEQFTQVIERLEGWCKLLEPSPSQRKKKNAKPTSSNRNSRWRLSG